VKEVRPLVYVLRPWFAKKDVRHGLRGFLINVHGDASRNQRPEDLVTRYLALPTYHDQIDKLVNIRQVPTVVLLHRYGPARAQSQHVLASFFDIVRIRVETVDEKAVTGMQGSGEPAIVAADVNHDAT
jgi:hypothetical protein